MTRFSRSCGGWLLLALTWGVATRDAATAQDTTPADTPLELDAVTEERVRLLLIDAVVVDGDGRTVPGLEADDFEVLSNGKLRQVDTLDIDCPAGAVDDVHGVRRAGRREAPAAPDSPRRIVLAFDYLHLPGILREDVLEQAKALVQAASPNEQFMLAALTGAVRIEQAFTDDHAAVLESLRRMQYDISLWNGNFAHLNEFGFVDGMTALFDLLGTVADNKAVVFYSAMTDTPLDAQFAELAGIAAASRCAIYPVDAWGLRTDREDERIAPG